jgi:hypothetical protein
VPTLPPLATVADLEDAMVRDRGSLNVNAATLALRRASARVRRYTRQDLSFVADDTIEVPGGTQVLTVPQWPLVVDDNHPLQVTELADFSGIEWQAEEHRDYSRLGNELTRGYPWQAPSRLMGYPWNRALGVWAPKVRLTYSHGYTELPDDILDVVLGLATMNMTNPEGLRQVVIDDYTRVYAAETIGNAQLTKDQKADLRPYRRSAFTVITS